LKRKLLLMMTVVSVSSFLVMGCTSPQSNTGTKTAEPITKESTLEKNTNDTAIQGSEHSTEVSASPKPTETVESASTNADTVSEAAITLEEAKQIALDKSGGGDIVTAVESYYDSIPVYKIVILTDTQKFIMHIGINDSSIYGYKEYSIQNGSQNSTNTNSNALEYTITEDEAKTIALDKTGGGIVTKFKLDNHNRIPSYEIEIRDGFTEYDIEIDGTTGAILEYEMDSND
jgi:uncharacterized membrane protein YkoI